MRQIGMRIVGKRAVGDKFDAIVKPEWVSKVQALALPDFKSAAG
jgi:hypothetical protein